jgi:hypothetical protein
VVQAGGFTDNTSGVISIFRPADLDCSKEGKAEPGAANEPLTVLISDLLKGKEGSNPEIRPGDIVTVTEAYPVYVVGGVNEPKQVSSREQTTLSRAVAAAGGVAKQGIESKVTVYRREGGETKAVEYDLRRIAAKEIEDPKLKSYDIVEVAEKGRERRKFPPRPENLASPAAGRDRLTLKIIE